MPSPAGQPAPQSGVDAFAALLNEAFRVKDQRWEARVKQELQNERAARNTHTDDSR